MVIAFSFAGLLLPVCLFTFHPKVCLINAKQNENERKQIPQKALLNVVKSVE
jgi:hypothetical protein